MKIRKLAPLMTEKDKYSPVLWLIQYYFSTTYWYEENFSLFELIDIQQTLLDIIVNFNRIQ